MTTMNNTTQQTTFWKFLSEHTIEIPIIQRDYAQGRKDKISLRKGFLGDLKNALDGKLPNGEKNLKLDFVYGSTENGKLQPLDGQQRLTTLWLLHWYIALRAGKLADAAPVLSKFTYETRISSREFCKQLCTPENFKSSGLTYKIVPYITNQTWFFSAWKQDPTIQAMLTMLSGTPDKAKDGNDIIDGIEEAFTCEGCLPNRFCKYVFYWNKLTSDDCPIIFYYLDLLGLKLSDDLYIKMNARGKQLTSFENFKADLIKYINEKKESSDNNEEKEKWNSLIDPQEGLPIKMDTTWMDIFWKNKSEDFKVDDIYFAFLNRFFLNYYIVDSSKTAEEIESDGIFNYFYGEKSNDTQIQYTSFSKYKQLDLQVIDALMHVLDNYHSVLESYQNDKGLLKLFPVWVDKNLVFIPKYANDSITTLTQPQRVVFYAICRYFEKCESNYNEIQFKQWMRVVWNIVENANVNTISTMIGCMRLVKELSEGCLDIYDFLSSSTSKIKSEAVKEQVREEIEKAKRILSCKRCSKCSWEDAIIEAENYAFFKGSIRFLFRDENGNVNWNDFDRKWENVKKYFKPNVESNNQTYLNDEFDNAELLKKLFSWFSSDNYWKCLHWSHRTFNNMPSSWRYYLLNEQISMPVHKLLMGDDARMILPSSEFAKQRLYQLSQTKLLDYVIKKIPNSWIREYHNHTAIFPSGWGVFLNADNRNNLLLNTAKVGLDGWYKVTDTDFLFGSDINFTYEAHHFQWHRTDFVYLMDDNWQYADDEHFCFDAKDIKDSYSLSQKLLNLIGQQVGRDMIVLINNHLNKVCPPSTSPTMP